MFSQTFFELQFSLGDEGKDGKNLNSQTWPGTPRRPSPRHPRPSYLYNIAVFYTPLCNPLKSTNLAKRRPALSPPLLPDGSQESVLKVPKSRAAKRGCFKRRVSRSGLVLLFLSFFFCPFFCPFFVLFCPFLSFLGLSRFFWDFPDLLGDGPGIFPILLFSSFSAYSY